MSATCPYYRKPKVRPDRKRLCLRCLRMFPSLGPQNRICRKCQGERADMSDRKE